MKLLSVLVLVIVIFVGGTFGWYYYNTRIVSVQNVPVACADPAGIRDHVYNPSRLQLAESCVTVSGVVTSLPIREADGDYHVWLSLDFANSSLANDPSVHNGDLVVEIVCALPITQQGAVQACQNYTNHVTVPQDGQHVIVSGPYVLDTLHDWYEIHPVYSLTIEQLTGMNSWKG